jgi:hypothetical protein
MKQFCIFMALFMIGLFYINAQDLIILKDGTVIEAKVMEIHPSEIRYKRFDNLNGPMIIMPADRALSIRYENGIVDIINATPTAGQESVQIGSISTPTPLQRILNALPAIPIAGNNLKFEFDGDTWTARINGENFLAGTIEIEQTNGGCILTLKQTHIWPGAAAKAAGRVANMIPGGGAVGGVLNTAGGIAGAAVGAVETSGEIVLEYKEGPPAKLSLIRSTTGDTEHTNSDDRNPRLNTVGVSVGSSFGVPWFVGSVHTTYSFFPYAFFEVGLDLGGQKNLFPWNYENIGYFFLYPYGNFCAFVPFKKGGWFAGIGFGVMFSRFSYPFMDGDKIEWLTTPALNLSTGFVLWNCFNISYTQRIRLGGIGTNGKLSLGFVWRY